MPRGNNRRNAAFAEQQPDEILRPAYVALSPEARAELRRILDNPILRRAWQNARTMKPSAMLPGLGEERGAQIANNRLHEIRGWELFEAAIMVQLTDTGKRVSLQTESYPDSARP